MTAIANGGFSRLDWTRAASSDAIAIARTQVSRADLPAAVEKALAAYEAVVADRKTKPGPYAVLAYQLAKAVRAVDESPHFDIDWPEPIARALSDLRRCAIVERQTYRLALAGKVWRVYRREGAT